MVRPVDRLEARDLAERAVEEFYRMRASLWAALVVAQTTERLGESEFFRMDVLVLHLEELYARAQQIETLFSTAESSLMRKRMARQGEEPQDKGAAPRV